MLLCGVESGLVVCDELWELTSVLLVFLFVPLLEVLEGGFVVFALLSFSLLLLSLSY